LSTIIVVGLIIAILGAFFYLGFLTMSDLSSAVAQLLVGAIFVVIFWGVGQNIKSALGKKTTTVSINIEKKDLEPAKKSDMSTFSHLTIHYSQKTDTPDTLINSVNPIFVTNNKAPTAYLMPDWLKPYVFHHKISLQPHDDERALLRFLKEYHGANWQAHQALPSELGLEFQGNILCLPEDTPESDLITKLKGRKLEDLRVVFLHRIRARRTLLLKKSTKEAFEAPVRTQELIANGIIADFQTLGMRPWDNCDRWSKRNHYTFHPWRYPESELTKGL
jgi:hypothetical protein